MKLEQIEISNYKSIENVVLPLNKVNGNATFCLFGINESGKSSILKAISLFEGVKLNYPEDYFDEEKPVIVTFKYCIEEKDIIELHKELVSDHSCPKQILKKIKPLYVSIGIRYSADIANSSYELIEEIDFENEIISGYFQEGKTILKKEKNSSEADLNLNELFIEILPNFFYSYSHSVLFWESSAKYLLLDEIDLVAFSDKPESISIPLMNCFKLSGINTAKIPDVIKRLNTPTGIRNLESLLSRKVTEHINSVWENHPISVLFEINAGKISLLIEDKDVQDKAKTTSQRSDGFKTFISFLLTISADDKTKSLGMKVLLIDEPETHLHPQAQINLRDEMIRITQNHPNSFVIYATHSNYLIDKNNLNRNFKVFKKNNESTSIEQVKKSKSTYSEVNYEVFDIPTTDYHNELFGYLEYESPEKLANLKTDRKWINAKTNKVCDVSLAQYIRHSIHHPENDLNRKYSEVQLRKSIEILRKLKYN